MKVRFARLVVIATVWLVGCAAQPYGGTHRVNCALPDLPVVRVQTANVLCAGVPVAAACVLSAGSPGDDSKAAVVDGVPASAFIPKAGESARPNFRRFVSARPAFAHAPLHRFDGACGDEVVLAGFRFGHGASAAEILRTPPEFAYGNVEGEVSDCVIVRVPEGDYAGFIGGPAGEYRAGQLSVWGIVVDELQDRESVGFSYLSVRRLPSEVFLNPRPPAGRPPAPRLSISDQLALWMYGLPVNSPNIPQPPVPVLHVVGWGPGCGFAVGENLVVTARHVAGPLNAIAVDGLPAKVLARGPLRSRDEDGGDWTIAQATTRLASPLPLDEREELPPGQRVLFGGFPGIVDRACLASFLDRGPVFCEGVVRECRHEPSGLTVWIDVPVADYHGVSGGPVVTVAEDGQKRLWGLSVAADWTWAVDWITGRTTLIAIPIPRELEKYAPGAFTDSEQ